MIDRGLTLGLIVIVAGCLVPLPALGQASSDNWALPRMLNGQPDLQGVWANNVATPLERPKELAGRQYLTEEEVVALKAQATQLFDGNGGELSQPTGELLIALQREGRLGRFSFQMSVIDQYGSKIGNYLGQP